MENGIINKTIAAIRVIRASAKNRAQERGVSKIDSFDDRSDLMWQGELIYRAEKQREKEYKLWMQDNGLSDDSRKWEFHKIFTEKVLAQSSLKQPPETEIEFDENSEAKISGRESADKLYWIERKRLKAMVKARERRENSGTPYCTGYDYIRELELEGQLNDRALLIAYYEYLQKLKNKDFNAEENDLSTSAPMPNDAKKLKL